MLTSLVALAGALFGFVGVVAGVLVTGRREEKKWFREQKLNGMTNFVTYVVEYYEHKIGETVREPADVARVLEKMETGRTTINLLCEPDVVDLGDRLARMAIQADRQHAGDEFQKIFYGALRSFTAAARSELVRSAPRRLHPATPQSEVASGAWPFIGAEDR